MLLSYHPEKTTMVSNGSSADLTDNAERNRLLAEMAEQSTDMISRHTPDDWQFIYASPAVEHLLGYSVAEIIGMSAYELYHPDDVEDFRLRLPSVSYERGLYTHTYRFRCKDGRYTWLESTSRSIRDPETGELKEILVVSRDASKRIEAEQTNRRLAEVLERSSDLVLFMDAELKVTEMNQSARDVLAVEKTDLSLDLGRLCETTSYQHWLQKLLPQALMDDQWQGELTLVDKQQRPIPVQAELLVHRAGEQVAYLSLVAKDLRQQRLLEAERQQYQAEVSHSSRLITMGEMASSLAHELNQPLTAIVNYVRGLQRRIGDKETIPSSLIQPPVEKIGSTALRAGNIIHNMMAFTRKGASNQEELSLYDVCSDVIQLCKHSLSNENIQVINLISTDFPAVKADRVQLEQILLNLVLNAIEACSQNQGLNNPQVQINAERSACGKVKVSVLDQGIGLADVDKNRLFEQFYTTKSKGLGMGLAISRTLVETHGGDLWAEEAAAGGAVFSFTLYAVE